MISEPFYIHILVVISPVEMLCFRYLSNYPGGLHVVEATCMLYVSIIFHSEPHNVMLIFIFIVVSKTPNHTARR